jgi:hypothetical protein
MIHVESMDYLLGGWDSGWARTQFTGLPVVRFDITYGVWRNLRASLLLYLWPVLAAFRTWSGKTSFVTTIICYSNSFNYAVNGVTIFSASAKLLKNNTAHHH